jgi:hypothetical protein
MWTCSWSSSPTLGAPSPTRPHPAPCLPVRDLRTRSGDLLKDAEAG